MPARPSVRAYFIDHEDASTPAGSVIEKPGCARCIILGASQMICTHKSGTGKSRRSLFGIVGLLILSLVVSVATRTFHATGQSQTHVSANSTSATRQHLDRDAFTWISPVLAATLLQAPTFYPLVAPAGPPVEALLLDQSLYNRPPPSC